MTDLYGEGLYAQASSDGITFSTTFRHSQECIPSLSTCEKKTNNSEKDVLFHVIQHLLLWG
jgi:hypothetical protein